MYNCAMSLTKNERDMLIRIDERTDRLDKARVDHETRIRSIEIKVWAAFGSSFLLFITAIITYFSK